MIGSDMELPRCLECDRPMRPRHTLEAQWPNTLRMGAKGLCAMHYQARFRISAREKAALRPAPRLRIPLSPTAVGSPEQISSVQILLKRLFPDDPTARERVAEVLGFSI